MKIIKKNFILLSLFLLPYSLCAWGDGDKLANGSCKFDKETGYSGLSFYTKDYEAFVIVDVTDSRYGTTSTIFNAITCEKITSGDKSKSNFPSVMKRKGFVQIQINNHQKIMDKSFHNEISLTKDSDNLTVNISSINSNITKELKRLISSLSNQRANSNFFISHTTKKFLNYKQFYDSFLTEFHKIPNQKINYTYAFLLNKKLKNNEKIKDTLIKNYFDLKVKKVNDIPDFIKKMKQFKQNNYLLSLRTKIFKLPDFAKKLTINNFLTSNEYVYVLKYMKPKIYKRLEKATYGLALNYGDKTIELTQTGSCQENSNTTSEFSCGFLWAKTCVGTYKNYSCRGDTSKIAQIERQVFRTVKVATSLSTGWSYRYRISRYTKSSTSDSPSGKNMCLGNWEKSYCYRSNLSSSEKNMCLGNWEKSYCYRSNLSSSQKNMCLGKWEKSYCYRSNLSSSEKNMCLGKWERSYCYRSNLSSSEKNMCLGKWERPYCYNSEI